MLTDDTRIVSDDMPLWRSLSSYGYDYVLLGRITDVIDKVKPLSLGYPYCFYAVDEVATKVRVNGQLFCGTLIAFLTL